MSETQSRFARLPFRLLTVAVALGLAWLLFWPGRTVRDDTPLPRGAVSAPDDSALTGRSELRVTLRMDIKTLADLISKAPYPVKDGNNGTIRINNLQLAPIDDSRLRIEKATAVYDGQFRRAFLKFSHGEASLTKSKLQPKIDGNWVLKMNPDVVVKVTDIDEKSLVPDNALKLIANAFFQGTIRDQIESVSAIPLKGLVEPLWDRLDADSSLALSKANAVLSIRPIAPFAIQPVVEPPTNTIRVGIGFDFDSTLRVGSDPDAAKRPAVPLPALNELPPGDPPRSRLRLPIVIGVADLGGFRGPRSVPGIAKNFRIESLKMTEKDGLLHGRFHFAFQRPESAGPLLPAVVKGVVRFQARPTCKAKLGRLGLSDFAFTETSNSLLVDLVGDQANGLIRTAIEKAVPELSDAMFRRAEVTARANVDELLASAISLWAKSVPSFSAELARASPAVSGIELKPTDVTVKDGHLIVTIQADATISIAVEGQGRDSTTVEPTGD